MTTDGRKEITLRANSSYATSSATNTTRTAMQMNLSLRDENPVSYRLNYDTAQNFQYVFVLLSVTSIKNPRHQYFQFCSIRHWNKSTKCIHKRFRQQILWCIPWLKILNNLNI